MPRQFRVQFIMQAGKYGWSEDHAYNDSASNKTLDQVIAKVNQVVTPKRSRLLGFGASMIAVRVSALNAFRSVKVFSQGGSPTVPTPFAPNSAFADLPCDNPYSCSLVKMLHEPPYVTQIYLRGLPAAMQVYPNATGWTTPMQAAYSDYLSCLVGVYPDGDSMGAIVLGGRPVPGPVGNINGATVDLAVPAALVIDPKVPMPGLISGQSVRVQGIRCTVKGNNSRLYNGKFTFIGYGAGNTLRLAAKAGSVVNVLDVTKANIWTPALAYFTYVDSQWDKLTHRKTGKVFQQPAGRSKTR